MSEIRSPPWCKWDLCPSGMLRGVGRQLSVFRHSLPVPSWPLKREPIGCPKTSVTTCWHCITIQKNKDLKCVKLKHLSCRRGIFGPVARKNVEHYSCLCQDSNFVSAWVAETLFCKKHWHMYQSEQSESFHAIWYEIWSSWLESIPYFKQRMVSSCSSGKKKEKSEWKHSLQI